MQKQISYKIVSLVFGILVICFVVGFYVLAWTEPTVAPPGDNVFPPLNTSNNPQTKTGALRVGGLTVDNDTYLATSAGDVGIGTTSPSERLDVNGNVNISGDLSAAGTVHSFAANGYQELPSGLIIQWGLGVSTIDGNQNFTFPTAFPNACFGVQTTITTANSQYQLPVTSISTSGFTINREDTIRW